MTVAGEASVDKFAVVDGAHSEELAGFSRLAFSGVKLHTAPQLALSVGEVVVTDPYAVTGQYALVARSPSRQYPQARLRFRVGETRELEERVKNPEKFKIGTDKFEEVILAINPTPEGEATSLYLERILKPLDIKITRLGRGLPVGGELEYADEETLKSAFEGRK